MTKTVLAALTLAVAPLGLAACGESAEQTAAPEAAPGLEATNARLVLPAVSGNPGAVYFDLANGGDRPIAVRAVSVSGAGSAMMHQYGEWEGKQQMADLPQLLVPAGGKVSFEPGAYHVMANDLSAETTAGSTVEVTLTIAGGDKISFPAQVRAAGEER